VFRSEQGENEYLIDLEESPYGHFEPVDLEPFKETLEAATCIGHNLAFDLTFLLSRGIRVTKIKDTFLGEYLLTAGMRSVKRNLYETQVRRLGSSELDKGQRDLVITHGLNDRNNITYSAEDVDSRMFDLANAIEKELRKRGMLKAWDLENAFSPVIAYMEFCGIYLDSSKWMKKVKRQEYELYKQEDILNNYLAENHPELRETFCDINWSSPPQVVQLFDAIGITVWSEKEEKNTVDAKHIRKFRDDFGIIDLYLSYKEHQKAVTTYGREWLNFPADDKRIHTKTRQMVETGRIASGNVKNGPFPNLANVPSEEETRSCFMGQRANTLVVADYSGQESMILADLSAAPKLLEFYQSGEADLHSYAARTIWPEIIGEDTPLAEVKKNFPDLRQQAKAANFAIAYGGNGFTIAHNLNISPKKGDEIYAKYMAAFPGLATYFESRKKRTMQEGSILVSEYTGRRRYIERFDAWKQAYHGFNWTEYREEKKANSEKYEEELKPRCQKLMRYKSAFERDSLNTPCQGLGAEMSKTAGILFYRWIIEKGYEGRVKIVNFVYDEWVVETTKKLAPEVSEKLQECMEQASSYFLTILDKIPASPMITKVWNH
jgi:DNA polymerase I-like protein with 3'-5' exonuclease and polymerase domains